MDDLIFAPMLESNLGADSSAGTTTAVDPTAGAEAGRDPSAGATPAGTATAAPNATQAPATPAPTTPAQRMFTQQELDQHIQDRLQRDRQQWATLAARYDQEIQRLRQAQQTGNDPQAAQSTQELQWIKETMEEMVLDRELNKLTTKFPDAKSHETDIMQVAVQYNIGLEAAYKLWRYDTLPNLEDFKTRTIDEYVKSRTAQAGSIPTPEGNGGTAPVANAKHDGTFETAGKRALERLKIKDVT